MILEKFIRTGRYSGKLCNFSHYNPANGLVWSDDIEVIEEYIDDKGKTKHRKLYGKWVSSDKVIWEPVT